MAVEQDLNAIAFPTLSEEQLAQLGRYAGAPPKKFQAGEALFRAGDRESKFFVIKSGALEIVDVTGDQPKTIRVIGPGEFTGDVGHLTGNPKVAHRNRFGRFTALDVEAVAVFVGNEPAGRVRCWRCALRLSQARRLRRRRRFNVGSVRP